MTDTQPAGTPADDDRDRCRSVMYWQAGARRSDSRHECELPDGHDGFHRAASGYTWGARPAERDGERRAAAGQPPGTLDGVPGVLGRALLDREGGVWGDLGDDRWSNPYGGRPRPREYVEHWRGPVREVLLVDPAAGRVLELVVLLVREHDRYNAAFFGAYERLAAAVDAYDRPTTGGPDAHEEAFLAAIAEPVPDHPEHCKVTSSYGVCHRPPHDGDLHATKIGGGADPFDRDPEGWFAWDARDPERRRGYVWATVDEWARQDRTEPAPEPAGDGPGWTPADIEAVENALDDWGSPELIPPLRALLADRDRLATALDTSSEQLHEALTEVDALDRALAHGRDAARAELAEVTASRDRLAYRQANCDARHQDDMDQIKAVQASRNHWRQRAETAERDWGALAKRCTALEGELATARRDAAADTWDDGARRIRRIWTEGVDPEQCARYFDALARTTRSGGRPVPGSPEPGTDGGETLDVDEIDARELGDRMAYDDIGSPEPAPAGGEEEERG